MRSDGSVESLWDHQIDAAGRLSAQLLLSNGSQIASLTSPDSVATGRFVYVKISVSISGRALSLTVASAVRSASLSSAAPVPQLSGQLIIGGFSGAPSAPAPRPVPGGKKRLKRSAPALPGSVASSVPPGYTAFSGVIAAPRLNRDMPLILGPVTSSLLDGLPGAIAASDSTSVVEGLAVTRLCDTFAPCKNGGTCVDGFYYTYSCQCHKGFSGVSCSEDFPDCNPNPCQTDEVCLERSDSLNYNLRFLPWPFNEPFRYELAAGFKCIKSYGSLAKSDFRSSGFFYATLVLSAGMICSIILAGIVLAFLFRSGRLTLSKPGQPNPNSSSQPNRNGLTCDSEGAYTTASVDLIISHGNRMRQAGAADAAEGGDPVYEMTMDQQYANVGPSNTTTTFQLA